MIKTKQIKFISNLKSIQPIGYEKLTIHLYTEVNDLIWMITKENMR